MHQYDISEDYSNSSSKMAIAHPQEFRLFWALDKDGDGFVQKAELLTILESNGLTRKDQRLVSLFTKMDAIEGDAVVFEQFLSLTQTVGPLVERLLRGELALPDFKQFSEEVKVEFEKVRENRSGEQATYIPPLAEVNPEQFGLAVISIDGQLLEIGDSETDFSVQSACKPFNYCFALNELGAEKVHQHVGMEPSGQPFNARVLMNDGSGRPHNPMINAGAIMSASLIKANQPLHHRLDHVRQMWSKMTGGSMPRFNAWMAQEESRTGDNNRALDYMMKAAGVLLNGEDSVDHELRDALELYFSACALEINARELATAAATLANGGVCPVTEERVFSEDNVRNCLTLMQICGMYDGSGEFSVKIGLPAKSGVGGAVILVVPQLMGICIWSPRLDVIGNSARGVDMATRLAQKYRIHIYDSNSMLSDRPDPRMQAAKVRSEQTTAALRAASFGDTRTLRRLYSEQISVEAGDYDQRTPLHLAAAEGHIEVVKYLLEQGVDANPKDRWGGTPLEDAELGEHQNVVKLLKEQGAVSGAAQHINSDVGITEEASVHSDSASVAVLLWAASEGDIETLQRCLASGVPISVADYDGRTALHLAASEGHINVLNYLLAHDHPVHVRDRWGTTPFDEAEREGHDEAKNILDQAQIDFHKLEVKPDSSEMNRVIRFLDRVTQACGVKPVIHNKVASVLDDLLALLISQNEAKTNFLINIRINVESNKLQIMTTFNGPEWNPFEEKCSDSENQEDDFDIAGIEIKMIRQLSDLDSRKFS